ncbi:hypothetical protein [Blastomonas sp.]|uniref:hypothetical protein n=1 Tax=Blastomonas sp. TaxID=1909299 RepID=UPI0035932164
MGQIAMARASYLKSARAMALCTPPLAWFCTAAWQDLLPPLTIDTAADAQQDASKAFSAASDRLLRVIEAHQAGKWRRMGMMALVAALTASLGLFGGYWWAKGNIRTERLAEVGELLRSSSGEDFCGDMSATNSMPDNNGVYCASWIKLPTE